ncbi:MULTISPECIES: hypothetical protein [Halobacterium]|uniref:hypothetical protein n=1 Tax=Halobacterium TaxID=2239 RepID=UPI00073EA6F1|nr:MULTISPECIES: hypothetical protein [Halobacterium]MCG1004870.1 hypothetical protein [Halobacterium noricense]
MTDETSENAEEAAEQAFAAAKEQKRHTSDPSTDTEGVDRVEAIKDALLAIEEGGSPENINIRDKELKALLVGLDEAGDLDAVALELALELDDEDADTEDVYQSDVARLLMRVGLRAALPSILEDAREAEKKKAVEQASGY